MSVLAPTIAAIREIDPVMVIGRVRAITGLLVHVESLPAPIGALVRIGDARGEVVGFKDNEASVMLLDDADGVRPGDRVELIESRPSVWAGDWALGRVVNGLGRPIDGGGPAVEPVRRAIAATPLRAMERERIDTLMPTGVRAIDLMTPLGKGQRVGIFAGPGVGKSTLLSMIAKRCSSDVNVIALIGERGREVREFIEDALGPEGRARSVVVVATSDEAPPMRVRAAMVACAYAELFRDRGMSVMLMVDSITRFAHAQRQIGLAVGEPPATKGYTPSVFAMLPRLLERAGAVRTADGVGSITGLYTVLVEGDDMTEPIADATRGILDGHLLLSRKLAQRGHFPAIDVLGSVSRVATHVADETHLASRELLVRLLAAYDEAEELIQIGAYAQGSNREVDTALALKPEIDALLRQRGDEREPFLRTKQRLEDLVRKAIPLLGDSGRGRS